MWTKSFKKVKVRFQWHFRKQFPKVTLEVVFSESLLDTWHKKFHRKLGNNLINFITSFAPYKSSNHYKGCEQMFENLFYKVEFRCTHEFQVFFESVALNFNVLWNDTRRETPSWNDTRADSSAVEMTLQVTSQIQDDWFELMASDVITLRCRQPLDFKQEIAPYSLCCFRYFCCNNGLFVYYFW